MGKGIAVGGIETDRIYSGDCLEGMRGLPAGCVQCCITSPPYFRLRDYGIEGQLGVEDTPEQYVERLVTICSEIRRTLKDDGVFWLNLGDCYWGSGKATSNREYWKRHTEFGKATKRHFSSFGKPTYGNHPVIKPKDLIGIPWMVAFALRKEGWYLRQDIIWHKPNVMPESCTDRCTKSHEYIFLLSKNRRYYFDNDAIKTVMKGTPHDLISRVSNKGLDNPLVNTMRKQRGPYLMANRRSVWRITNKPFKGAHFATFPSEIPELCIKAGSREGDVILDPFMGSGTTALVAKRLNRHYIGFELNPDYVRMAEQRIALVRLDGRE
ncbi:site-specific DNA-methyltransferase [Parapedobacter sp. ISTM3]|uniref:DNA-methyltransferase n=1 Tax=Parapedobacter sp. ISTM3 TaxID=2800130 RepID=UPI001907B0F2|nr:site-specific DNA-methyltransferase [Parapedobacter sp. ISTM3]MBK1439785.1 site-specific DNA-methyltransferase [Parapedobacter sp. ISTM3]